MSHSCKFEIQEASLSAVQVSGRVAARPGTANSADRKPRRPHAAGIGRPVSVLSTSSRIGCQLSIRRIGRKREKTREALVNL